MERDSLRRPEDSVITNGKRKIERQPSKIVRTEPFPEGRKKRLPLGEMRLMPTDPGPYDPRLPPSEIEKIRKAVEADPSIKEDVGLPGPKTLVFPTVEKEPEPPGNGIRKHTEINWIDELRGKKRKAPGEGDPALTPTEEILEGVSGGGGGVEAQTVGGVSIVNILLIILAVGAVFYVLKSPKKGGKK